MFFHYDGKDAHSNIWSGGRLLLVSAERAKPETPTNHFLWFVQIYSQGAVFSPLGLSFSHSSRLPFFLVPSSCLSPLIRAHISFLCCPVALSPTLHKTAAANQELFSGQRVKALPI